VPGRVQGVIFLFRIAWKRVPFSVKPNCQCAEIVGGDTSNPGVVMAVGESVKQTEACSSGPCLAP